MKNDRKKRVEEIYPLTPLQQGLMFHSMFAPGSGFYIVQFRLVLQELNTGAFKRAWQQVIDRHQILRTAFVSEGVKEPVQVVLSKVALNWREEDWRVFSPSEVEQKLQQYLEWDRTTDYDLRQAPLMRVALMQIADDEYHFVWSHHHLLLDGWSVPLVIKEVATFYEANCKGETLEAAKPRPYRDYIAWLDKQDQGAAESFWRQELQGITAPTKLSIDRGEEQGAGAGAWEFAEQLVKLNEELTAEIQRLARREKITLNTIVQGAWALLLGQYSGESRVMFGTTVSGRPAELAGVERMVGLFINAVPLQVEIKQDETVVNWLKQIQQKHTEIRQYEYTPLVKIQSWSEMSRGLPLFNTILAFANYPLNPSLVRQGGLKATSVESMEKPHYPLSMAVTPGPSLSIKIRHDCSRYEVAVVKRLLQQLERVLGAIVAQAQQPLAELELVPQAEREILAQWNETSAEYARETCIHELFEQQVERTPNATAVIYKDEELSYRELNARANQLAHLLRERGVSAGEPVGLCVERSIEMVVGMLGVLKAGGGYVPIDSEYPRERVAQMLSDSGVRVLLTQQRLSEQLPEHNAQVVELDANPELAQYPDSNLNSGANAENLAYMIYTSGSTGMPKGVMVPHRALGNHMAWMQQRFPLTTVDRVIQKTPFSFDASVWEFYAPLLTGAQLVMAEPGGHADPGYLVQLIKEQQVTTLQLVPTLLERLLEETGIEECASLGRVFCGGEALSVSVTERFREKLGATFTNLYGPTEVTIDSTYWECEPGRSSIPIGKPVNNTQAFVLDEGMRVVPIGVAGELYLGGESLATGYWQRAGLTAERFVPNPYSTTSGARLYRTGDVVRWNEAGELEYFGRNDQQVKIRGFRIETGEIESALQEREEVGRAVVLVREEEGRGKQLAAFVVSSNGVEPSSKELREYLQGRMPEYMVPASITVVGGLPLMPNGKVDRQALLAWNTETAAASEYEGARNQTEELLVQVWQEVLGLERVGIHDNFFELGGDSIVSIQVIARMRQHGVKLKLKQMFSHSTIAELAQIANTTEPEAREKDKAVGAVALTPIQQHFFSQELANPHHYNQAVLLETDECPEASVLEPVMQKLVTHHAALRLRFTATEAGWQQAYAEITDEPIVTAIDLSHLAEEEQRSRLEAEAAAAQASLNISDGPVIKVVLFNCGGRGARMLLVVHHLVIDGVSWRILLEDLQTLYGQAKRGEELALPAATSTFKRWSERLIEYAKSAGLEQEASYWLRHGREFGRLPVDEAGENTVGSARSVEVKLSREETLGLLQEVPKAYHTQIQEVLMTVLTLALRDWTASDQLLVEMEGHGREEAVGNVDVSRTVGWFTSIYPVQLELQTDDLASALKSIKEQLRGVPEHGIGYGVWRYLGARTKEREPAVPEVSFNYLGQFDQVLSGGEFRAATESAGATQSPESRRSHLLAINGMVIDGQLQMGWAYSEAVHRRETIERVAAQFVERLQALIAHCQSEGAGGHTPSDFPLARVEQTQLESIESKHPELEDLYPMTPLQQGLLFHSFLAPGSGVYLIQLKLIFQQLNKKAFQRAWQQVIDRHEILRTVFVSEGVKKPVQVVLSKVALTWHEEDWRRLSTPEVEQKLQQYLEWDRTADYDFDQAPLMRVALMQIADDEYHFVWSHHHLILDGWSVPLLIKEMAAFYEANCRDEALELAKPRPYREYIAWLDKQDQGAAESFWRQELQGITAPTKLSIDRGATTSSADFRTQQMSLSEELTTQLRELGRQEKITLNTIVQGAWALLLGQYSGESRVMFGTTVSGRPVELAGVERMVGMFINTVPLHVEINPSETVVNWLKQIQQKHTEIRQYEHTPLVKIQSWSEMSRGLPLFDTTVAFGNYPVSPALVRQDGDRGLIATSVESEEKPHYPLGIAITPGQSLFIKLRHDCSRYEVAVAQRLLQQLERVLGAIVAQAQQPLAELELMPQAEREILAQWNETSAEYARETCIHELFEQQVERTPNATAVIYKDEELSYRELNARANQLAHLLRERGVNAGEPVGLCVERSIEMVVGMLGVLKAGGGYVPIDSEYPRERVAQMLSDSGVRVLLTQSYLTSYLSPHGAVEVRLDDDWEKIAKYPQTNLSGGANAENLAYMIYTSGSTGMPKGVMVPHRALGNHMAWMQQRFPLTTVDRVIQKTPFSFDASVWEFYAPLLTGAQLVMAEPGGHADPGYLVQLIKEQQVTTLQLVPTLLERLLEETGIEECASLGRVFCGGEALSVSVTERFREKLGATFTNLYGPTEVTIDSTYWECEPGRSSIPIGKPVNNTQAFVLDEGMRVVPIGVAGELYLGGESLATGYWQRAGLTAERFVPNPYSTTSGARLYRTGDVVRWNEAGELEYFGRNDQQVKIRGFRIETGEIESALQEREEVGRAVVLVREEEGRGKQLAAFVVSSNGVEPSSKELREYLQGRMPEYMVPASITVVGGLPLMPNGKVDRQALLAWNTETAAASEYEGARNQTEELLVQVWQEVLGLERVSIHDNFFELGGDSIVSIQVIARMRQHGVKLKLKQMFSHSTIAELAQIANTTEPEAREKDKAVGAVALTPIQQRFFEQEFINPHHYNQAVLLETDECPEASVLEPVMQKLVTHHAALRLRFTATEVGWQQAYTEITDEPIVTAIDLSHLAEEEQRSRLEAEAAAAQASLNIATGPVMRVVLFNCGGRGARMLLVVHHLVIDGVSWRILLEDLQTLYGQAKRGEELALPAATSTFKRWSETLKAYANSAAMQQEAGYWQRHDTPARLPVDDEAGENTVGSTRSVEVKLSHEETQGLLQEVPKAYHTQIQEVLMTALTLALRDWTVSDQLLVEMEGHGREEAVGNVDVSRTVGWFTSTYPVQLELQTDDLASALKSIKEQLRGVPEHGIGYGVWHYLGARTKEREPAVPEVSFNYLGQFDQVLSGGEFRPAAESAGAVQDPREKREHLLAINGMVVDGQLQMRLAYSEAVHRRETIERIATQFTDELRALIAHCQSEGAGGHTPSDFPLARIEQKQLEVIEQKYPVLDLYPLTPLQQGLMFHSMFAPGSGFYIVQFALVLQALNKEAFKQAWQQVIDRHEILRTAFVSEGVKEPVQVVLGELSLTWHEEDWRVFAPSVVEQKLQEYLKWDRTSDYDFRQAPVMRVALMQIGDDEYHFVWSHHHLLLDGWSVPLLIKEMAAFYEANCNGQTLEPAKPRPYRDYIAWLNKQDDEATERFWRQELQGITAPTKLSIDRGEEIGVEAGAWEFSEQLVHLSEELTAELQRVARQEKITLNTIVQGAWALLLSRYSGDSRVMFGTTVSGRPGELAGVERMIGMFINTVPLQVEINQSETVASWLKQIQQKHTEIRQYEFTPLMKIQSCSDVPRGLPMFETVLGFENYPLNDVVKETTSRLQVPKAAGFDRNHYPLSIAVMPGAQLALKITYNSERFPTRSVDRMFESLEALLQKIVVSSEATLMELLETVDKAGAERKRSREQEREKFNFSKLINVRRKAITGVREESVL